MKPGCYIAGTGLVSVQGLSVQENWQNLYDGKILHETGRVPIDRDPALARVSQLAILAADEALRSAGRPCLAGDRVALIVGTSKGPVDEWLDQLNGRSTPDVRLGLAQVAADVAAAIGHGSGPRLTLAGACASGLHALLRARDLLQHGDCEHALVVAAESSLNPIFAANFTRLGVLADPAVGCKPFDVERQGFLLAEGAAAVWLTMNPESPKHIQITNGALLADATHITGNDRRNLTLEQLIRQMNPCGINLIHAHGTGTLVNDECEISTVARVFDPDRNVSLFSHKHAIGHTQGASGLISVVLNTEMHIRQYLLGNSNSIMSISSRSSSVVRFTTCSRYACINRSVVIASGFGGAASIVSLNNLDCV